MKDRHRIVDVWLGTIERAIARGDGVGAGILTRQYVQRCRELGLLGPRRPAPRDAPLERPNDGEIPVSLPIVTRRWDRRDGWEL
jgi:hypothetical protein